MDEVLPSGFASRLLSGNPPAALAHRQSRLKQEVFALQMLVKMERTNKSFAPLKQIDAGLLSIGYAEAGSANGRPVILLHGWPYDIYSYVNVAPLLASKGYRVIIPYLRSYGTTRFLSSETFRNAQPSASALDIIALMDALKIEKAILYAHRTIKGGIGHNLPQEAPQEFAKAVVEVDGY
ncbi:alpha/beta hydrolase fold protein [Scytonema sp. HK-05]|uniref:alpha/beta fold hydrolase n=1 Tax=Scytonema sp. HK-05 TaxID=1137095 RepID=UPI000A9F3B70|nr:alpha/beta fold hydrolase [Scytonema sp. HK-05]BAY49390.1 alpha/beta hydrolase fold protein [Scytonema sp. HK-05]